MIYKCQSLKQSSKMKQNQLWMQFRHRPGSHFFREEKKKIFSVVTSQQGCTKRLLYQYIPTILVFRRSTGTTYLMHVGLKEQETQRGHEWCTKHSVCLTFSLTDAQFINTLNCLQNVNLLTRLEKWPLQTDCVCELLTILKTSRSNL